LSGCINQRNIQGSDKGGRHSFPIERKHFPENHLIQHYRKETGRGELLLLEQEQITTLKTSFAVQTNPPPLPDIFCGGIPTRSLVL
jgi:hypothetical protein